MAMKKRTTCVIDALYLDVARKIKSGPSCIIMWKGLTKSKDEKGECCQNT